MYVAGCATLGALLNPSGLTDFDVATWPAVQQVLHGHPLHIYEPSKTIIYAAHGPRVSFDHGPISLLPLSVAGLIVTLLGWAGEIRVDRAAALATSAIFALLMAREAVAIISDARGLPLPALRRLITMAALVLVPALGLGIYTHVELPIGMWLYLRSFRDLSRGHVVRSGLEAALAVMSRTTVVLLVLPLGIVILRQLGRRAALLWGAVLAGTVAVVMMPFIVADPEAVWSAFVVVRGHIAVGYGSFLVLAAHTPLESLAQHGDVVLIGVGVLVVLWLTRRTLADAPVNSTDVLGVVAAVALCFPLFSKTSFAYYLLEPSVLTIIWLLSTRPSPRRSYIGTAAAVLAVAPAVYYFSVLVHPNPDAEFAASIVVGGLIALALWECLLVLRSPLTARAIRVGGPIA